MRSAGAIRGTSTGYFRYSLARVPIFSRKTSRASAPSPLSHCSRENLYRSLWTMHCTGLMATTPSSPTAIKPASASASFNLGKCEAPPSCGTCKQTFYFCPSCSLVVHLFFRSSSSVIRGAPQTSTYCLHRLIINGQELPAKC